MSDTNASNNRRIAKNTLMLYIRMLLSMVVSLYTSRVVLNILGIEDYGVYNVVGGIVSMFSFLNASMSGATSRFLIFEMGKGDFPRLKDTFSSSLIVHIGIALVILILAETVGLWFLMNKLVIPENRIYAAYWVYQLSILSMVISVTQVPYNASIIAHEKMDVYAYIEIVNVVLKLLIVYLLTIGQFDKLILYAVLTLSVSVLIAFAYRIYCLKKFEECRFYWILKPEILRPMLLFSGWDLYGNMSVTVCMQGISILLNIFFGPILNTANGIANTVQNIIKSFAFNIIMAFRPQIVKKYATNNISDVCKLIDNASKYSLCMFLVLAIPLYFEADHILHIWLGVVPDYTVSFLRIILIASLFNIMNNVLNIPIHATGKIKKLSFITGTNYFLIPVFMYIELKLGISVQYAYSIIVIMYMIGLLLTMIVLKQLITQINVKRICLYSYLPILVVASIVLVFLSILHVKMDSSLLRLLLGCLFSITIFSMYIWRFILIKDQRIMLQKTFFKLIRF